jgi:pilus assembly protein CpaC
MLPVQPHIFAMRLVGTVARTLLVCTALAGGILAVSSMSPARAQESDDPNRRTFETDEVDTPRIVAGREDGMVTRRLRLSIGRSVMIDLPRDAKEVFVANPAVANAVVRTARRLYVIGVGDGTTTLFVNDAEGRQIAALDVLIARERGNELQVLRETLSSAIPGSQIDVRGVSGSYILTGEVATPLEAQRAVDIATSLLMNWQIESGDTGETNNAGRVVNGLTIRANDQVMLKVTIAEVERQSLKALGIRLDGTWQTGGSTINFGSAPAVDNPVGSLTGTANAAGGTQIASLRVLEQKSLLRTLAEPTLTAVSGQPAKFLAGGEIPFESCVRGEDGVECSILFKPYGVSLAFTPVVLSENRISVTVDTEVTDVDPELRSQIGSLAFKTRRTQTTVELPSGGMLATAGLLRQTTATNMQGLPGLKDLPIIGALFRSRRFEQQQSELLILVTPFIVKPTAPGRFSRPDDGFVDASDPAQNFLGKVNRVYGAAGNRPGDGFRAPVGFIAE